MKADAPESSASSAENPGVEGSLPGMFEKQGQRTTSKTAAASQVSPKKRACGFSDPIPNMKESRYGHVILK